MDPPNSLIAFLLLSSLHIPLHIWGDYILQSGWMAGRKRHSNIACTAHAIAYTVPFLAPIIIIKSSLETGVWGGGLALLVIGSSHWLIDRFNLAAMAPLLRGEGYGKHPRWVELIIDQGLHLTCNAVAFWL